MFTTHHVVVRSLLQFFVCENFLKTRWTSLSKYKNFSFFKFSHMLAKCISRQVKHTCMNALKRESSRQREVWIFYINQKRRRKVNLIPHTVRCEIIIKLGLISNNKMMTQHAIRKFSKCESSNFALNTKETF